MFSTTNLAEFKQLCAAPTRSVGIYLELLGDQLTPISVYQALGKQTRNATLLESSPQTGQQARYSHIGIEPIAHLQLKDAPCPMAALRKFYQQYHCYIDHPLRGFLGGIVGFIAYDAVRQFEVLPTQHAETTTIADFDFIAYQTNITFDHLTNKVVLSTRVSTQGDTEHHFNIAQQRLTQLAQQIKTPPPPTPASNTAAIETNTIETDLSDAEFAQLIEQAKEHIAAGDIFQVVLSRQFSKQITASPFSVYRALRLLSPAPYLFYLDRGDTVITGASPEKLISVANKVVDTVPIAGTRPRSPDPAINQQRTQALLHDEKELAEHVMLVDLARNDLGRTCQSGSIQVKNFCQVQQFSHVMHITSEVSGTLQNHYDAFDALQHSFPAGTLSGAPKIRAMEIIDKLECNRRGAYGGAICFIDNHGNLNSCITIRTAIIQDNIVTVRAGAGIVLDSDPQQEANETRHKAQALFAAIELAEGGLA